MTFTPVTLTLPDPRDRAYTTHSGSLTIEVAGRAGEWTARVVSPLRTHRGPVGFGRSRAAAVRDLTGATS